MQYFIEQKVNSRVTFLSLLVQFTSLQIDGGTVGFGCGVGFFFYTFF